MYNNCSQSLLLMYKCWRLSRPLLLLDQIPLSTMSATAGDYDLSNPSLWTMPNVYMNMRSSSRYRR